MIGTSFAVSIERGDIPAMQNSAEHGPRPMLNGILFNQVLAGELARQESMWQAIQYVGSPLALLAFVVAAIATAYRSRLRHTARLLEELPEDDRAQLLTRSLETYHITHDNLTREQRYQLMLTVLEQRAKRLKILAMTSVAITAILACGVVAALLIPQSLTGEENSPKEPPVDMSVELRPSNELGEPVEINPYSEFYVTEDTGAFIQEYPKGRVHLDPVEATADNPYALGSGEAGRYSVKIPTIYSGLLSRGAANIHFVIKLSNSNRFFLGSMPLHQDSFGDTFLDIRLTEAPGPKVVEAFDRMKRVLKRLTRSPDGKPMVDGKPIEERMSEYYSAYFAISEFVAKNPDDIKGVYETVWEHGGAGRTFINETEAFETVVSGFFYAYQTENR